MLCSGFFLFFLAGLYTIRQQDHVNRRLCIQTVENRDAIRSTWNAARDFILIGQSDQEVRERTNAFFSAVLEPIPELKCVGNRPVPKEG